MSEKTDVNLLYYEIIVDCGDELMGRLTPLDKSITWTYLISDDENNVNSTNNVDDDIETYLFTSKSEILTDAYYHDFELIMPVINNNEKKIWSISELIYGNDNVCCEIY